MRRRAEPPPGVSSPCTGVCTLHPVTRLCVGCARTGEEIARWASMTEAERRAVMATLADRRAGPPRF